MTRMLVLLALATQTSSASPFAGTWIAEHKGTVFVRLEIQGAGASLQGSIALGNVSFDDKGLVREVAAVTASPARLTKLSAADGLLTFFTPSSEGEDQFQMRVLGGKTAEITLRLSPEELQELKDEGIPTPGAIPLRRLR